MEKVINPKKAEWSSLLERPTQTVEDIEATVNEIFQEVKHKGDEAILRYTSLFDGQQLEQIEVSKEQIERAVDNISEELKTAINLAKSNIEWFHKAQITAPVEVETMEGVNCWTQKKAIQKVGLYIPGGSAPLFSTVLMLAVPAQLAGCEEVVLCSPPNKDGSLANEILYTAHLCGIKKVFKVGGIQAIAALTYGSETIPAVYKIFGPGNQFVTVAKQIATKYGVAIDMPAGPSELMVYADESANSAFVASDLLSQAEHGTDSQVVLVTTSKRLFSELEVEINAQMKPLPRKEIAGKAIQNSKLILLEDETLCLDMINEYAPEHLIIVSENEDFFLKGIKNAGSVFVGAYTPESAGDYASGTNHTLPTNGYAKQYSGVNLDSFLKSITFQKISEKGLKNIGPSVELMAEAEGLQAHKHAITLRLNQLKRQE
ncbi:MAG: histidinol dehydrogenase [Flavobacteriaceae bacterium]|nr:histidinol dehydrogenase [Flavobacteriaceae bacterium]